jgi:hypothetical protein|tara:strand:+ start:1445 stop:1684 length:240 start_codon:yes stop_codon:yes gene_type:complete
MCIICVELEKNKITPLEAQRSLAEMAFDLDLEHFLEVEDKIQEIEEKNQFSLLLQEDDTVEMCTSCHCDPCDCDFGTCE